MDDICRLCCSKNFVNNYIFDEENALFLKMSMYLPIKVFKNDPLPQKICDKCSCKVNDFYQFCNETLEVENRLRKMLSLESILTSSKETNNKTSIASSHCNEQSTQTDSSLEMKIKVEPQKSPTIKQESDSNDENDISNDASDSDDNLLINIKKNKKATGKHQDKMGQKKNLIRAQFLDMNLEQNDINLSLVKEESDDDFNHLDELDNEIHYCCICFVKCKTKNDMLQHYKTHLDKTQLEKPPMPPPFPIEAKCDRCKKTMRNKKAWKAHWQRHWLNDRPPLPLFTLRKELPRTSSDI
ncbi:unnamed protein product [Leptosia nina]|uniref:ZAD domain-containing protein n=1 Tax=Leptosia nina TaxID=320188 RepID=A0AAV1JBN2_9NEOP